MFTLRRASSTSSLSRSQSLIPGFVGLLLVAFAAQACHPVILGLDPEGTDVATTASLATSIKIASGNQQSTSAYSQLAQPLTVHVLNSDGDPVPDLLVKWEISSGDGTLSANASATDANGYASILYTAGVAGSALITASVRAGALSATFTTNATFAHAPSLTSIPNVSTNEDGSFSVSFDIDSPDGAIACSAAGLSLQSSDSGLVSSSDVTWSGTSPHCVATFRPRANAYGSATLTVTVSAGAGLTGSRSFAITVNRQADDASTASWPFDAGTNSSYAFDSGFIELVGGVCRLKSISLSDDSSTTFSGGTHSGTTWDGSVLKLSATSPTNANGGIEPSWAPHGDALRIAWHFDEVSAGTAPGGADVIDFSGRGNHGTGHTYNYSGAGHSAPGYGVAGKVGKAVSLYNDPVNNLIDYFDAPTNGDVSFGPTESFTVSAWAKAATSGVSQRIAGTGHACWSRGFMIGSFNGYPITGIGSTNEGYVNNSCNPATPFFAGTTPLNAGEWHMVTAVYDQTAKRARLYVDGVQETPTSVYGACGTIPSGTKDIDYSGCANPDATSIYPFTVGWEAGHSDGPYTGSIDEVAVWAAALSSADIKAIYDRQVTRYSGTYTSRIVDVGGAVSWTSLGWTTSLPFFKELTSNAASESTSSYAGLANSTLMNGIAALWHFDETAAGTASGGTDFRDDSGNGHHGSKSASGVTIGDGGILSKAVTLDGSSGRMTFGAVTTGQDITYSMWVKPASLPAYGMTLLWDDDWQGSGDSFIWLNSGGYVRTDGHFGFLGANTSIQAGVWSHIVFVASTTGANKSIYVNGVLAGSDSSGPIDSRTGLSYVTLGDAYDGNARITGYGLDYFKGQFDETAIWNRALSAAEVAQVYRRGASRLKFQVRSCTAADCSDAGWKGPDGTSQTYFSELNNNTAPLATTGDIKTSAPAMTFSNFTSPPANGRYFQYRALLETDSTLIADTPELTSVVVGPSHYAAGSPAIVTATGSDFADLSSFQQILGSGCDGGIKYQLSLDKTVWYYWNGAAWAISDQTSTQANSSGQLTGTVLGSFKTQVGTGNLYVRSILISDGSHACELSQILFNTLR